MTNALRLKQQINNEILDFSLDKYADYGLLEVYSDTLDVESLYKQLKDEFSLTDIIVKENFNGKRTIILGDCPDKITVVENDLKFIVQLKQDFTGFDLSKFEFRNLIQTYASNKNVLNLLAYTGADSIYAVKGNAKSVTAVDGDPALMQKLKKNFEINSIGLADLWDTQLQEFIDLARESRSKWDLITLDLSDYNIQRLKQFNLNTDHRDNIKTIQQRLLNDAGILIVICDNKQFVLDQYIRPGADKLTNKLIPEGFKPLKPNQIFAFYN
jgi:23S rRNA G2069 N7-methylase RlmK/C1962 C5-methylase RlmI